MSGEYEDLRANYAHAASLAHGLEEVARIVGGIDPRFSGLVEKLRTRAHSVLEGRFRVLVAGEFKRGKSTFLNAMLGQDILPVKVAECTAVVTVIRFGDEPSVRIRFLDGAPDEVLTVERFKSDYMVKEEDWSGGETASDRFGRVDHAELSYPIELCRHRVELVDSPGLGAHQARTRRTREFLPSVDAVVFVLDATHLLTENEPDFLENVVLPLGLRNIFFVVNKWNMIEEQILRPEQADAEKATLNARIQHFLTRFCTIDGVDHSEDRIFRVNALGALRGRMRRPPSAAMIEESNVPAFEASLRKFLVEGRGKARNDSALAALRVAGEEVDRFVETQAHLGARTLADIEAERDALQPSLDRLRGIKTHIEGFLDVQSATLQDRLSSSFQDHIRRIDKELGETIKNLDYGDILQGSMVLKVVADVAREDQRKLSNRLERQIAPQITRHLEKEFGRWQSSVVKNELKAVSIDVEKHLQDEAKEYLRVLRQIEDRLGVQGGPLDISEQVDRWLGGGETGGASAGMDLSGLLGGVVGDMGLLIAGIVAEIVAEMLIHLSFSLLTIVGGLVAIARMLWREAYLRQQIGEKIEAAIREKLRDLEKTKVAQIRGQVREDFLGLKAKVTGNIEEEIALIDASIRAVIERVKAGKVSAAAEQARLESAREKINAVLHRTEASLA